MYPPKIQHIWNWSCLSLAQNSSMTPHFTQSISQSPSNGPWRSLWSGIHVTYLNSLTHLPFAFLGSAAIILIVSLTNKKPCSCPKAYHISSLLCPQKKMHGSFPFSFNLNSNVTFLMRPTWEPYLKLQTNPHHNPQSSLSNHIYDLFFSIAILVMLIISLPICM